MTLLQEVRRFARFVLPHWRLAAGALLLGILRAAALLVFPAIMKYVIDGVVLADDVPLEARLDRLHLLLLPVPILFAVVLAANYWRTLLAGKLSLRIILDVRQALFAHIQKLGMRFHEGRRVGETVSRLMEDVNVAQQFVSQGLTTLVIDGLSLLVIVGALVWIDWRLTLLATFVVPLVILQVNVFRPRVRRASRAQQERGARLHANYHEKLAGYPLVLSQAALRREERVSFRLLREFFRARIHHMHYNAAFSSLLLFITQCAPFVIFWFGAWRILKDPADGVADPLTIGALTAFLAYLGEVLGPLNRFADLQIVISSSMGGIERLYEVFDARPDVAEPTKPRALPTPLAGRIAFEDVTFSYAGEGGEASIEAPVVADNNDRAAAAPDGMPGGRGGDATIRGVRLALVAGGVTALVGPSGGGKSTLVKLLLRFYDPDAGRITIDGIDLRDVALARLREQIGYVSQEIVIFSGTIRENIAYGRAHAMRSVTEAEIIDAARAAAAWEFIERLPLGLDTQIGERGMKLSAGQRQRLAIARLFLKNPPIVVLDEATSALDSLSEEAVQKALDRLMAGRTTLVVAHRLSTIRHADAIHVVEGGRVTESGTHSELVARGGMYAELNARQMRERVAFRRSSAAAAEDEAPPAPATAEQPT